MTRSKGDKRVVSYAQAQAVVRALIDEATELHVPDGITNENVADYVMDAARRLQEIADMACELRGAAAFLDRRHDAWIRRAATRDLR